MITHKKGQNDALYEREKKIQMDLINEYSSAINSGRASLFIGSGISISLGLSNWKDILRKPAEQIGLTIDEVETPLPEIAQYYVNDNPKNNKQELIKSIRDQLKKKFDKEALKVCVYQDICDLPISEVWTTNYDDLIEYSYNENTEDKKIISFSEDHQITREISQSYEVTIFHMHGTIPITGKGSVSSEDIVITSDDYDEYSHNHAVFSDLLKSGLMRSTFLFIGFSFDDPNIRQLFAKIKSNLKSSGAHHVKHYMILYSNIKEEFDVQKRDRIDRDEILKIKDLSRYNIKIARIFKTKNEPNPLNRIIRQIKQQSFRKNIVLSGSKKSVSDSKCEHIENFSKALGVKIIENERDYVLHTCYGGGVGSSAIQGALDQCIKSSVECPNDRVKIWPTYQDQNEVISEMVERNRTLMIREASICIFIGGENGTEKEYNEAKKKEKFLIPIPAAGGRSEKLFKDREDLDDIFKSYGIQDEDREELKELYKKLNVLDVDELTESVMKIINIVHDSPRCLCV